MSWQSVATDPVSGAARCQGPMTTVLIIPDLSHGAAKTAKRPAARATTRDSRAQRWKQLLQHRSRRSRDAVNRPAEGDRIALGCSTPGLRSIREPPELIDIRRDTIKVPLGPRHTFMGEPSNIHSERPKPVPVVPPRFSVFELTGDGHIPVHRPLGGCRDRRGWKRSSVQLHALPALHPLISDGKCFTGVSLKPP